MFPWVYDFKWEPTHLVFLAIFFTVVLSLATLLVLALARTLRALQRGEAESIQWAEDFEDLPASSRACRHEIAGKVAHRSCPNGLDCRICEDNAAIRASRGEASSDEVSDDATSEDILGFNMPKDRRYHRGHSWVRPEADGTVTVGLDSFASRLIGTPDEVFLPDPGSRLMVNGTAWRIRKGSAETRVLSPVDGEVTERGKEGEEWYLRVRPAAGTLDSRHMLEREEIRPWLAREMDRLQGLLSPEPAGNRLADGGVAIEDLSSVVPESRRDEILGEMLLEP